MDRAVALHYAASAFSGAMNAALAITLSGGNDITEESDRLLTELLSGVEDVESAAVLEGLEELAGIIREKKASALLESDDPEAVQRDLLSDDSEIGSFYRGFMERHGHRCIREAELREPEWAVEPAHLIESLKALISAPDRPTRPSPRLPRRGSGPPGRRQFGGRQMALRTSPHRRESPGKIQIASHPGHP